MQLSVRSFTGDIYLVQVSNTATVLDVKREVEKKDPSLLLHLQRLVDPEHGKLSDGFKLAECGIGDGATLNLVVLTPCNIHIQTTNGKMHTAVVLSSEPENYTVRELHQLVGKVVGHSMGGYQLHHQGRPVLERNAEKEMTLKDYSIRADSTVVMTRMGLTLNVTNPMVDVCFLVDCTGSMGSHIKAVKNTIQNLRDRLVEEYKESDLQFSFVRYTDYDSKSNIGKPLYTRTSFLQFTSDPGRFQDFVSQIRARGGAGDGAEDVMGGFKVAFNLSWRPDSCKILIHIGDSPCHGDQFHSADYRRRYRDRFPHGDPTQITHESMMAEIVRLDIQYWFGYVIKPDTNKMIEVFNECLSMQSEQRLIIRQFDAKNCDEIGEAVQRSVITSVYSKAALAVADTEVITIDTSLPDWNSPSIFEQTAKITPKQSLTNLEDELKLENPCEEFCFKIAPNPFFEGSECFIYHASDLINFRKIVLKRFKQSGHNGLEFYIKKLEVYTLATTYACKFNAEKPDNICSLNFNSLNIIQSAMDMYFMLEPFLVGNIARFENNSLHSDILQAFSHRKDAPYL